MVAIAVLITGCGASGALAPGPVATTGTQPPTAIESTQLPATTAITPPPGAALPTQPVNSRALPTPKTTRWLDSQAVAQAVRPHHGAFNTCHRLADNSLSEQGGEITVGWLVHATGTIEEARVARTTFSTPDVSDCVLAVAMRVQFPASRSPAEVSWTVRFRGSLQPRLASTN